MKQRFLFLSIFILALATVHLLTKALQAQTVGVAPAEADAHPFQEKCEKCHADEPAYPEWRQAGHAKALVNLLRGPYPVRDSCLSCHSSGSEILRKATWPADAPYNKDTAVNAVACSSCHMHSSQREHYLVKPAKQLCVTCHKMDCGCAGAGVIHQSQSEMFLGREGVGVGRKPSPHVKVMKKRCVVCHMAKEDPKTVALHGGHTFKADFSICSDCHENMETALKGYRAEIESKMEAVKAMLDSAPDLSADAYKAAKRNYDMVKGDSGYGLHNIPYARALLDYSLSLNPSLIEAESDVDAGH